MFCRENEAPDAKRWVRLVGGVGTGDIGAVVSELGEVAKIQRLLLNNTKARAGTRTSELEHYQASTSKVPYTCGPTPQSLEINP